MIRPILSAAALLALSLAAAAAPARAQAHVGISAGASIPTGDFGSAADAGFNLNGLVDVLPPMSPIGFRAEVGWNQFDLGGNKANIINGTGNIVLTPATVFMVAKPYLIGGIGAYNTRYSDSQALPQILGGGSSDSQTSVGFNGGVGFKSTLGGLGAFLEARFVSISGKNGGSSTTYVPITFGLTF